MHGRACASSTSMSSSSSSSSSTVVVVVAVVVVVVVGLEPVHAWALGQPMIVASPEMITNRSTNDRCFARNDHCPANQ